MKNKILNIILATGLTAFTNLKSQVANYAFSQTNTTYSVANTGTLIGTTFQEDDLNILSLPFTFNFNGTPYNDVYVYSNGFISLVSFDFNTVAPGAGEYFPISNNTQNVISAFGQNLIMGTSIMGILTAGSNTITNVTNVSNIEIGDSLYDIGLDFGGAYPKVTAINGNNIVLNINSSNSNSFYDLFFLNGSIRMSLTGTDPNRVCEFVYKNMARYSVYGESINFKIRLYETTNVIEVVYGDMLVGSSSVEAEVGLKGMMPNDFNSRLVNSTNTWSTSVSSINIFDNCAFSANKFPSSGLTYKWSPQGDCSPPTLVTQTSSSLICSGNSATLSVSGANTYSWSTGENTNSIIVSPNTTTTYTVFGMEGSCSSSITVTQSVSACTSINDGLSAMKNINVSPNPFNEYIYLSKIENDKLNYEIYDVTGKVILNGTPDSNNKIETTNLNPGIYFIKVYNKEISNTKKIIKN